MQRPLSSRPHVPMMTASAEECDTQKIWCTTAPSGFRYTDDVQGQGPTPAVGQVVKLAFTGNIMSDGRKVEFANGATSPLRVVIGKSMRRGGIPWDEVICGMAVGGERRVLISPSASFLPEASASGGEITAGETIRFEVQLLSIETGVGALLGKLEAPREGLVQVKPNQAPGLIILFLSFLPYFLPDELKPDLWKEGISSFLTSPPPNDFPF